ncbi:MAG: TetR/AcrR family transcriptional regulator [Sneathiella sp.]
MMAGDLETKKTQIRRRRSAIETRAHLLQAAAVELIKNSGGLEMTALAKRAGLSEGLAYHYFGNRAGVIAAVVDAFYDRYEEAVIDVRFVGKSWSIRERQRVTALVSFFYDDPLTPIIFANLGNEPEVVEVESRRFRRQTDLAAKNVREAQKNGDIDPQVNPAILGAMMLGAIRWGIMNMLQTSDRMPKEEANQEIWSAIDAMSQQKR